MVLQNNDKSILRKRMLMIRDAIPEKVRKTKNQKIFHHLINLQSFVNANSVCCYGSFKSEVNTKDIISYCLNKGIVISLPKIEMNRLTIFRIEDIDELKPSKLNIPEPTIITDLRRLNPKEIDIVIVPGVVFDINKNRIGYGKGYYDRFLSETVCKKVALSYEEQIIDFIPIESHDIKMDVIVTDERVING
ncbi:MAG: 5-formyltetrahydrofolate cyclo-ligase [Thermodesulfovibrionales bacterium]|nr:5-formyltetrahydrofolate cyclo-ligase [Thermodesulfovibrionales bacterium]